MAALGPLYPPKADIGCCETKCPLKIDSIEKRRRSRRSDAVDLLRAFDINRDRIYAIAAKVYARGRRGSYELNVADV
jgi:hypothetical protein